MTTGQDTETIFAEARDSFLTSLAPEDQAQFRRCLNITEVLEGLRDLSHFKTSKTRGRLERCFKIIHAFGDNLSPYFKTMEIFFAGLPEWANFAFGSLRLILQLASHFTTFFEKLCQTIESLTARLPRYEELYNSLKAHNGQINQRLKESMQSLYVTLFEFFEAVSRVFSNKHGKVKRTPQVVADLLWKPFDMRFQVILKKIDFHRGIVKEEFQTAHQEAISMELKAMAQTTETGMTTLAKKLEESLAQITRSFDNQARGLFLASVYQWISAPDYSSLLERAHQERTEGTTEWLLSDGVFKSWRESEDDRHLQTVPASPTDVDLRGLLWISGNPGCGKTVLASSIISELGQWSTQRDGYPATICHYFFTRTVSGYDTMSGAIRAIAAQVFAHFHQSSNIHDMFSLATYKDTALQSGMANNRFSLATDSMAVNPKASIEQLTDVLSQCLTQLPNIYFIFDGFDECTDNDALLKKLRYWCMTSPLKVILLSRPDVAPLRNLSNQLSKIELTRTVLRDPLTIFVEEAISDLIEDGLLPEAVEVQVATECIAERAEGMFLWVRLMTNYLRSPAMTKTQRLKEIMEKDLPDLDRLDEMYRRIYTRIRSMDKHSVDLARDALLWIADMPLSSPELREALYPAGWDADEEGRADKFDHAVILCSCGLLEKDVKGFFRYIHLSALQFVQNGSTAQVGFPPLIPDVSVRNSIRASRCLSYLIYKVPEGPLSGSLGSCAHLDMLTTCYPLLKFATLNWLWLLIDTIRTSSASNPSAFNDVLQLADHFLHSQLKIMAWVEAFHMFNKIFTADAFHRERHMLIETYRLSQDENANEVLGTLKDFVDDMTKMRNHWWSTLNNNPAEIWGDITLFTDSQFLRHSKAAERESLAPRVQLEDREGFAEIIAPTFSIAMSSAEAHQLATLNIYPAKPFLDGWRLQGSIPFRLGQSCKGLVSSNGHLPWFRQISSKPIAHSISYPKTRSELLEASSGWAATFEILDVSCSPAKNLHFISLTLVPEEVGICLRQSLRFFRCWTCHFPITIAPNLQHFTILNRVFHAQGTEVQTMSAPLPLNHFRTHWCLDEPRTDLIHRYQITWSPDSRRLAFIDEGHSSSGQECYAILLLRMELPEFKLYLFRKYSAIRDNGAIACSQFHPHQDVFLFVKANSLYLWDTSEVLAEPKRFYEINSRGTFPTISFSHCGTVIAILYPGRSWPHLIQLPTWCKADLKRKLPKDGSLDDTHTPKKLKRATDSDDDLRIQLTPDDNRVRATTNLDLLLRNDGKKIDVAVTKGQVTMAKSGHSRSIEVPVIKLPGYLPSHLSATISLPRRQNSEGDERAPEFLSLVLSPAPMGAYSSDEEPLSTHLPIVVRKDMCSLGIGDSCSVPPTSRLEPLEPTYDRYDMQFSNAEAQEAPGGAISTDITGSTLPPLYLQFPGLDSEVNHN
ncbi:hypothetical protein F5Y16DRAFT_405634 [Xylariaceae sp. FL0255]|nr:hypothetical protein F5Y16DRAFT_405634 [Xylariaceae sp. FL0255]